MNKQLQVNATEYLKAHERKHTWQKVVTVLASVVVFCTTYALIMPAVTMEEETFCGIEQHPEHTDECYEKVLACTLKEGKGHVHDENCYEISEEWICGLEETEGHTHSEGCYEAAAEGCYFCGLEETDGHVHDESCYVISEECCCGLEETDGHTHGEGCYDENGLLICKLDEIPAHHHTEECRKHLVCSKTEELAHHHTEECVRRLVCTLEETAAHHHTEECRKRLICGQEECEPHTHSKECYAVDLEHPICGHDIHVHTLQCYSNPDADVEVPLDWEGTTERVELTTEWADDLLAIAKTQLGYRESKLNYHVLDDGETKKGYTRYGAWMGDPYGDWCAMFASFCLNYAKVDPDFFPHSGNCQRWIEMLSDEELDLYRGHTVAEDEDGEKYIKEKEYIPVPGDLVFFDRNRFDPEHPEDRVADHVGIVCEVSEAEEDIPARIQTIEGNAGVGGDSVAVAYYDLYDAKIMGYGQLPKNPDYRVTKTVTLDNDIVVSVVGPVSSFPFPEDEIALSAEILYNSPAQEILNSRLEEEGVIPSDLLLLDVSLRHGGEEVEPVGPVKLSFETGAWLEPTAVYHVDEEAETITDMEAELSEEDGILTVETEHFSTFALTNSTGKKVNGTVYATWVPDGDSGYLAFTINATSTELANVYFGIGCNDGSAWLAPASWTTNTYGKNAEATVVNGSNNFLTETYGTFEPGPDTQFHVHAATNTSDPFKDKNYGYSTSFTVKQLLEQENPGFSNWMTAKEYAPATIPELYTCFTEYLTMPTISVASLLYADHVIPAATVSPAAPAGSNYHYVWQYKDVNNVWQDLPVTDSRFDAATVAELAGGQLVRCCLYDSEDDSLTSDELRAISNELSVNPNATVTKPVIDAVWTPGENGERGSVASFDATLDFTVGGQKAQAHLEYSDDGSSWTNEASSEEIAKNSGAVSRTLADDDASSLSSAALNRQWRIRAITTDNNHTELNNATFTIFDILNSCKRGFSDWLMRSYEVAELPMTQDELYAAFEEYYALPSVSISKTLFANHWFLNAEPSTEGNFRYQWQYQDDNGVWQDFGADTTQIDTANISALADGRNVRCGLWEVPEEGSEEEPTFYGFSEELFVDPGEIHAKPEITAQWSETPITGFPDGHIIGFSAKVDFTPVNNQPTTVQLRYSDDDGDTWNADQTSTIAKNAGITSATLNDTGTVNPMLLSGSGSISPDDPDSLNRMWKMDVTINGSTPVDTRFNLFDILEACKSGFCDWLLNNYLDNFGGDHLPTDQAELYEAFEVYYGLPTATVGLELDIVDGEDQLSLNCDLDREVTDPGYEWEYYDESTGAWVSLYPDSVKTFDITDMTVLNGGKLVRVKVYSGDDLLTVSESRLVDNANVSAMLMDAIETINTELNLSHYPVGLTSNTDKNSANHSHTTVYANLALNLSEDIRKSFDGDDATVNPHEGSRYSLFYWDNIRNDSRVPVPILYDENGNERPYGDCFAEYLARLYLQKGMDAVEKFWKRYLFDIYDPTLDNGGQIDSVYQYGTASMYPDMDYGDPTVSYLKDKTYSSFHATEELDPVVLPLKAGFGDDGGIDYQYFVSDLTKYAEADAAGDANEERKYKIDLTADCQAVAPGPVALIFQIQTSWQMFDLLHANAMVGQTGTDNVEVGAVANNTELGTLYDIKNALLGLMDYMDTNYPGNNLVIGITETKHDASQTMFLGEDENGNPMFVSNDYALMRQALENFDTFGNCEHVHYSDKDLVAAITNLPSNLDKWKDFFGRYLYLDDIEKSVVIIGGPTENSAGTNGYKCPLPWSSTFNSKSTVNKYALDENGSIIMNNGQPVISQTYQTNLVDTVYGIRTNRGNSYVTSGDEAGTLGWLDYSANNSGAPFHGDPNATTTYSNFTKKYVATSEQAILSALIDIVEKEMQVKRIPIEAQDKYVNDLCVNDTVNDEFRLDPAAKVYATVWNSETYGPQEDRGHEMIKTEINWTNGQVTVYPYSAGVQGSPTVIQGIRTVTTAANGDRVITIEFNEEQTISYDIEGLTGSTHVSFTDVNPQVLTIVEHAADGTTDVSYNFGTVYNTKKCELNFGVVAKEDYIGSNNVFTNEGLADLTYQHPMDPSADGTYLRTGSQTPEVNVPIRYPVTDGGDMRVWVNTTVNDIATEPELYAHEITDAFEALLDNYDQINGTVNYAWIDSHGNVVKNCGDFPVVNGVPDLTPAEMEAIRRYSYTPTSPGFEAFKLQITFSPLQVDPTNEDFHNDGKTVVPVNELSKSGKVLIEAIAGDSTLNYNVIKKWEGEPPENVTYVQFRLTNGYGYYMYKDSNDVWQTTTDPTVADLFTLSSSNDWECEIRNLPSSYSTGSGVEFASYTPEEVAVDGYAATYTSDTLEQYQYDQNNTNMVITVNNTTANTITSSTLKYVQLRFLYNNVDYSRTYQVPSTFTSLAPGESYSWTVTEAGLAPDFSNDAMSLYPFTPLYAFTYSATKAGKDNAIGYLDRMDNIASARLFPIVSNAQITPVLKITNARATAKLTVKKTVPGASDSVQFPFTAEITNGGNFTAPADGAGYTLDENGIARFYLAHEDEIELEVPLDAVVIVTETEHDGYYPLIKVNTVNDSLGDSVTVTVNANTEVEFENTSGYRLPSTGGFGTTFTYALGAFLTGCALVYGCILRRRRERRTD